MGRKTWEGDGWGLIFGIERRRQICPHLKSYNGHEHSEKGPGNAARRIELVENEHLFVISGAMDSHREATTGGGGKGVLTDGRSDSL